MSVAVLIPWRDAGCKHRDRALVWVIARLAEHGWPVILGHHHDGAWCKAAAIDDALTQTDAAVLVIHDADVWCNGLPGAVEAVQQGAAWAIPHRALKGIHRLTEDSTTRYLAGDRDGLKLDERPYDGVAGGGIAVVPRATYEACPLDPRFLGYGGEDESWGYALKALHGAPWRGTHTLTHLYHPPQERLTRQIGSNENHALRKRYARARFKPDRIAALIEEARPCLSPPF